MSYSYKILGHEIPDTFMTAEQALAPIPGQEPVPADILAQQRVIDVKYWRLDNAEHVGKMVVNDTVVDTMHGFFELGYKLHFPFGPAIPAADTEFEGVDEHARPFRGFQGNDLRLQRYSVSHGFNFRQIAGTDRPSKHGEGLAADFVQQLNSYDRYDLQGNLVTRQPDNAIVDPNHPSTFTADHPLVQYMLRRDMVWGGFWTGRVIDKQHFGYQEE